MPTTTRQLSVHVSRSVSSECSICSTSATAMQSVSCASATIAACIVCVRTEYNEYWLVFVVVTTLNALGIQWSVSLYLCFCRSNIGWRVGTCSNTSTGCRSGNKLLASNTVINVFRAIIAIDLQHNSTQYRRWSWLRRQKKTRPVDVIGRNFWTKDEHKKKHFFWLPSYLWFFFLRLFICVKRTKTNKQTKIY